MRRSEWNILRCRRARESWPLSWTSFLLTAVFLISLQFLSTLFAPLNFVMEKVESILPSSLWHQLTRIWGSLPSFTFHTIHHLFCANLSWTARKHDFEKGKPFWDFKLLMDYQFLIKGWFCCTKFIDVQFYFILPSKLTDQKVKKINK